MVKWGVFCDKLVGMETTTREDAQIVEEVIPENETPLQRKIRENRYLTASVVAGQLKRTEDSREVMEKKRAEEADKPNAPVDEGSTRVTNTVTPEDLKPSPYSRESAEDVVANERAGIGGERFERRTDEEVGK